MKHDIDIPNLHPTLSGSDDALPFSELLSALGRSGSTGILRAELADGERHEVRLAHGRIVRVETHALAALVAAEGVEFTFRNTVGEPHGEIDEDVDTLLMHAAFAIA